ncbi:MAG: sulfatase-like hydrolase/transferase [Sedimentisphaeraceae bacterium JB056]
MNRRGFLKTMGSAATAAGLMFSGVNVLADSKQSKKPKPNFVFIFLDDAGWGDIGCYGNQYVMTPNIDKMADEGTLFTHFYVNASVCAPTRVAFLTGKFPGRLGVHHVGWGMEKYGMDVALPKETLWLMQVMQKNGYRTGHYGKWHLAERSKGSSPEQLGVDEHRTLVSPGPGWDRPDNDFIAESDELIFDEGIKFIERNKDKPFYLNLWSKRPHTPICPSQEQMNVGRYKSWQAKGFGSEPISFTTPYRQYYATMTESDKQIGRFMTRLRELGLDENTIVIFSSDNGPESMTPNYNACVGSAGPFRGRKRSLYDGGIRVPFIVRWPGKVPAGKVNDTSVVSGTDWFPTVCDIAGINKPDIDFDGENVSDIFFGSERDRRIPLMWEFRFAQHSDHKINSAPMLAIREGKWKLLMNPDRSRVELYDIVNCPMEVDNVADRNPVVVKRLEKKIMAYHNSLPRGPIEDTAGKNDYPWPK